MVGRGRPSKTASVGVVRELTRAEIAATKRSQIAPIQRFRDSHHRIARLFASGLRVKEVAELTGYSVSRISLFHTNPAFQQLIAEKRLIEDEVHKDRLAEYNDLILSNGFKAERKLADKLDDDDESEELSVRELISIARDAADRVGLSKRAIQTNVSIDFAALLDRAIKRSSPPSGDLKLIAPTTATLDGGPESSGAPWRPTPHPEIKLRRRI
jgi:hypothetical protein